MSGYKTVEVTEFQTKRMISFIKICGVLQEPNFFGRSYEALTFTFGFLSTFQLLFSIPFYLDEIDSIAMQVYHASLYSATPLSIGCLFFHKYALYCITHHSNLSYDYNSKIMEDIQNKIIREGKTGKIRVFATCMPWMLTIMVSNFIINSFLDKFVMGQKYLQFYDIWYPSFVNKDYLAVELITYFIHISSMLLSGFTIFSATGGAFLVYCQMTSELSLLSRALSHLDARAREISEREGISLQQAYREAFRMCAEHHIRIIGFFVDVGPGIQMIYTLCYFIGLLLLTCTGFAFTFESLTVKIKFAVVSLIQYTFLYGISWCAEEISTQGELVNEATYGIDWLAMPPDVRSSLRILLLFSQRPLQIRMIFGQLVSLDGYMSLVKASYSYFNMMLVATRGEEII
uniref:Odorant receptor n=1 Tax=Yemma signatus TaxID=300820 RepID=A0A385H6A3_9HEMI|nr:odorant receptor [Yemma signatus]